MKLVNVHVKRSVAVLPEMDGFVVRGEIERPWWKRLFTEPVYVQAWGDGVHRWKTYPGYEPIRDPELIEELRTWTDAFRPLL